MKKNFLKLKKKEKPFRKILLKFTNFFHNLFSRWININKSY